MTEKRKQILDLIIFLFSLTAVIMPPFLLYVVHRVIRQLVAVDPSYSITSGTVLASRLTVTLLVVLGAIWIVFLRRDSLRRISLINTVIGVVLTCATIFAVLTQVMTVLPMVR